MIIMSFNQQKIPIQSIEKLGQFMAALVDYLLLNTQRISFLLLFIFSEFSRQRIQSIIHSYSGNSKSSLSETAIPNSIRKFHPMEPDFNNVLYNESWVLIFAMLVFLR